ncbi:hypothetical protein DPPLL_04460 [Desulfofustis limnaeus]|uniref:Uncharacterized protein n=1 Tax=Desulfofustis limnaeus TaxID=2740163 RepID=A0ABN6LZL1_9BACT|nr:hypothetical protein DPPLL_04460 [Desulfofustis limnaeus]
MLLWAPLLRKQIEDEVTGITYLDLLRSLYSLQHLVFPFRCLFNFLFISLVSQRLIE